MTSHVLYLFLVFLLLSRTKSTATTDGATEPPTTQQVIIGTIGAIVDYSSRMGKEQKTAMEMAVQDFYDSTGYKMVLHLRDSYGHSARAASAGKVLSPSHFMLNAAMDLIGNRHVQAIVGTLTWQDAALVAEMDKTIKEVPIISVAAASINPSIISVRSPFVVHMGHDIGNHMRCIAAIIGSFRWRKVIAIYEDSNTYTSDSRIITLLSDSLRGVGAEIEHYSAFPPMYSLLNSNTVIEEQLKKLRSKQCKVFIVVQSSLSFTALLFEKANQMGMMRKGYIWISTDGITSLLNSVNSSVISSMQGVLGFKTYFLDTASTYNEFEVRFRRKFRSEYLEEEERNPDPSIFALRAYDATWATAKAMERLGEKSNSTTLLETILSSGFKGLSGGIHFKHGELSYAPTFRVVNVVGKSYRELGFWSPKFGFSETFIKHDSSNRTVEVLGPVYWPGGAQSVPMGWMVTAEEKPLRIGVPARSAFTQFARVSYDEKQNITHITGFAVDVFEAAVKQLPYHLPYQLVPFYGSYNDMVEEVYHKTLDAAVGDTVIMADRCRRVEFSQPYIESGLVMVVTVKSKKSQEPWMFMKPFTKEMWILTAAMSVFTGFVVWLIEQKNNHEFRGTPSRQIGTLLWFSFSTLYLGQRESLRNNLSRVVVATWLFLILIVSTTFTASLSSMMTVSRLEPSVVDIGLLKRTNAVVGCNGNSIIVTYLVFPKGSPLALDISEAILRATENGELQQLEDEMLSFSNCSSSPSDITDNSSLGPRPFSGLFFISGGVSTVALFITVARLLGKRLQIMSYIQAALTNKGIWRWASTFLARSLAKNGIQMEIL
ncbi:hypothetical protein HHK36_008401 [Tetracentron sinense]|uniref:Glutamate receptor n=1 Tax=Tetracentron sinense TaxID=13715 RepID=A0A834ZIZ0_TETSI|nr:hypothetical protein HHK36_008401 [Tetracentron sinense]